MCEDVYIYFCLHENILYLPFGDFFFTWRRPFEGDGKLELVLSEDLPFFMCVNQGLRERGQLSVQEVVDALLNNVIGKEWQKQPGRCNSKGKGSGKRKPGAQGNREAEGGFQVTRDLESHSGLDGKPLDFKHLWCRFWKVSWHPAPPVGHPVLPVPSWLWERPNCWWQCKRGETGQKGAGTGVPEARTAADCPKEVCWGSCLLLTVSFFLFGVDFETESHYGVAWHSL